MGLRSSQSRSSRAGATLAKRFEAPEQVTSPDRRYRAIVATARGQFTIDLIPEIAPVSVNSFVFLARSGFYDATTFHRVIPGFIAQGGDPSGSGRGNPGYRIPDELSAVPFEAGVVGMANAGPNSNGSQFFVVLADAPQLNGRYTAFGRVAEGLDVVRALRAREPASGAEAGDLLKRVTIIEADSGAA